LSKFKEQPRFYVSAKVEQVMEISKPVIDKFQLAQWTRDLNRLVEKNRPKEAVLKQKIKKKKNKQRRI